MAFKAEELMILVLPSHGMWAACKGADGGDPGDASHPASGCESNSQKPCPDCEMNTCRGGTHPATGCQENTQRYCDFTQNPTQVVSSGLALLRQQMQELLAN